MLAIIGVTAAAYVLKGNEDKQEPNISNIVSPITPFGSVECGEEKNAVVAEAYTGGVDNEFNKTLDGIAMRVNGWHPGEFDTIKKIIQKLNEMPDDNIIAGKTYIYPRKCTEILRP
jgi:hypothetical protein